MEKNVKKHSLVAAFMVTACLLGTSVQAATVSFNRLFTTTDDSVIQTAPSINVNNDTAGLLTFDISIATPNALLSAVYVDLLSGVSIAASNLASLSSGVDITSFEENTNDVGMGRGLSGNFDTDPVGPSGDFSFGFGLDDGDSGGAGRQVELPFRFTLDDLGSLSIFDVSRIGLRFQSVGDLGGTSLGGGSEKVIAFSGADFSTPPAPVPLPAALPLLVFGLGTLGVIRTRRRKS